MMIRIGEAAQRIGVKTGKLRYWEAQGWIRSERRNKNRVRWYREQDLEPLRKRLYEKKLQSSKYMLIAEKDTRSYRDPTRPRYPNGNLIYYEKKGFRNRMEPRLPQGRPAKKEKSDK